MDKKNLGIIIAVVFIVIIVAGYVLDSRQTHQVTPQSSDRSSSLPAAKVSLSATASGTIPADQSPVESDSLENGTITADQAGILARRALPELDPDQVNITNNPGDQFSQSSFVFDLLKNNERIGQGELDPRTGSLVWYAIPVKRLGRPASPAIATGTARITSDNEIRNRNGVLSLNMSEERYDPIGMPDSGVAGAYVFVYDRLDKKYPCDSDGFTVDVDSVSGRVIEYRKTWIQPPGNIC
ncbi:hypothetical protein [Methanoregula sp.]|uniref:hypothetical protein n=1 Tax=Methanoregula sp. TaxID=2052170 RepID=UPI003C71FB78